MSRKHVKVIVLRTAGTNCDVETAFAFEQCGAQVDAVHINKLLSGETRLDEYHILALPGGFTYGDDIASGKIIANELRVHLGKDIAKFVSAGKLVIGICNGFQTLVKAGFLPGNLKGSIKAFDYDITASLISNDSGKFEDRWTHLKVTGDSVWTKGIDSNIVYYPVAHAEGKFVVKDKSTLEKLIKNNQIVFRYCTPDGGVASYPDNPNGAIENIAGITDSTGHILGLMPHPERHILVTQHPYWTRKRTECSTKLKSRLGDGARIFENGVKYTLSQIQ